MENKCHMGTFGKSSGRLICRYQKNRTDRDGCRVSMRHQSIRTKEEKSLKWNVEMRPVSKGIRIRSSIAKLFAGTKIRHGYFYLGRASLSNKLMHALICRRMPERSQALDLNETLTEAITWTP